MSNHKNKITLMIPGSPSQPKEYEDRLGGEQNGFKEVIQRITGTKDIDSETLKKNIERTIDQIDGILDKIGSKLTSAWKVESICVGLSVNAEGSIGIATAGIETSIEISFSPK